MQSIKPLYCITIGLLLGIPAAHAGEVVVEQKDKRFSTTELEIQVGDSVRFTNEDPFFHNVFSLSDAKFFDLGSYPKGTFKEVVFDQPGDVEVECAIHPQMQMVIHVKE